jgi:hypothetical protein
MTSAWRSGVLTVCLSVVAVAAGTISSKAAYVFVNPERNSFWTTATNTTITVPVDYPEGATTATLTVSGLQYSATYANIPAGDYDVTLPAATSATDENVFTLTLSFDKGGQRIARLGMLAGLDGGSAASARCLSPETAARWPRAVGRAVLPVPYGTTSLTVDGNAVDTGLGGAQGWYALGGLVSEVQIPVTLTVNGTQYSETLVGDSAGLVIILR